MFNTVVLLFVLCYVAFGAWASTKIIERNNLRLFVPPLTLAEICVVITFAWLPIVVYTAVYKREMLK